VVSVEDFMEIHMGEWEGMTTEEIAKKWADDMEKIYRDGIDLPRGTTGETWAQLTKRFSAAVAALKHGDDGPTVAVAHGGAIRSYISSLTKTNDTHSESLFTPANTSLTHVAVTERGPEILDYSVSTHLETLQ
jgi:broad specificity phosphatase PhoE